MINVDNVKITIDDYVGASSSTAYSVFKDEEGNRVAIDSETLYLMFRFMMFELEREGTWENFQKRIMKDYPGIPELKKEDV